MEKSEPAPVPANGARRVIEEFPRRSWVFGLAGFVGACGFVSLGLSAGIFILAIGESLLLFAVLGLPALLAGWVGAMMLRAARILWRSARGGQLVRNPSGAVLFAKRPVTPGTLAFRAERLIFRGMRNVFAWPYDPSRPAFGLLSPAWWCALPPGPLGFGLSGDEIRRLDHSLVLTAGVITGIRFDGPRLSPYALDGGEVADRCEITVRWGSRELVHSVDLSNPAGTMVKHGPATIEGRSFTVLLVLAGAVPNRATRFDLDELIDRDSSVGSFS